MTDSHTPRGAIPPGSDQASEPSPDPDDAEGPHQGSIAQPASVRATHAARPVPLVAGRRQFARTTPVVVDRGRATFGLSSLGDRRQLGQIGLVVLMAAALGALFLARLSPPETPGLAGAGSPTPHESVNVTAGTSPYASASPVVSPAPSASLIPGSPTPAPTHARTYSIKSGDTLSSIAAHFHTTAKILEQLNGIKSPFVIHPGEVLKLP
jgi:nucleoid-associated protein YgaU